MISWHVICVKSLHFNLGLPSVKKYNAMAKVFDPIKTAGQKGDSSKAKELYDKVSFNFQKTGHT